MHLQADHILPRALKANVASDFSLCSVDCFVSVLHMDGICRGTIRVAQPLLAVWFSRSHRRYQFHYNRETHTAKSGCATKARPESTFSTACTTGAASGFDKKYELPLRLLPVQLHRVADRRNDQNKGHPRNCDDASHVKHPIKRAEYMLIRMTPQRRIWIRRVDARIPQVISRAVSFGRVVGARSIPAPGRPSAGVGASTRLDQYAVSP
jgi:hypothetical protein